MSVQFLKDKSREISYALIRVAFYIKRSELRGRIENLAFELLENTAKFSVDKGASEIQKVLASISALDSLVRLGHSIYEIEPVNATILVREFDNFNSAIRQFGNFPYGDEQLPNIKNFFSSSSEEPNSVFHDAAIKKEDNSSVSGNVIKNEKNDNGSGINTAIRKSAIINMIKSGNGNGCRLKDLIAAFPDISERTLRYDLQKLCELGVIERVGNGGPASFYVFRGYVDSGDNMTKVGNKEVGVIN